MATSVFTQCDGAVYASRVSCDNPNSGVFPINFSDSGASISLNLPITSFALEREGNFQFVHTMNDFIYFHIFGDRISQLQVSGMGFIAPTCNAAGSPVAGGQGSIGLLHTWYEKNRAAGLKRPVAVTLGNSSLCGAYWAFLTGMRLEIPRPDILVAQWALRFHVIPNQSATT